MNYYILAGEASGDLHGANLMKAIKANDTNADFRFWGGDLMEKQGGVLVKHYKDLAFMGFIEVLIHIRTIFKNLAFCKQDLLAYKPDVLILVDYPGFNLRIAEFAKQNGLKVFYYISPQIWAWKQGRVHKIKKIVDRMAVILPFEEAFYNKFDYKVYFVGHPLLDAISTREPRYLPVEISRGRPVIALLPGSRKQEISKLLPLMLSVIKNFPGHQFVIGGAPSIAAEYYKSLIGSASVSILYNETYTLLEHAEAAIVTSGTATLETALFGVPEVVCYTGSALSYYIAKKLIKVKYISLVNLIMDKEIVKELIQADVTTEKITAELNNLIFDKGHREEMLKNYAELKEKLGGSGASAKAARLVQEMF